MRGSKATTGNALVAAGLFCALCAGVFAAMFEARRRSILDVERRLAMAAVGHGAPHGSGVESVLQLPKIVARSDRDGILVTLRNDTSNRQIVIDRAEDRLVVECESVPAGPLVRVVSLDARTLAPGEAAEPVFLPLGGRWESARVRFEHRDRHGVCSTEVTIP